MTSSLALFGKWFRSSKAYWLTPTRWATFASFPLIPIVIAVHILLLFNVRYLAWPENFVWPYLSQNNFNLYKDIFYIYPPLYFWLLDFWGGAFGVTLLNLKLLNYLIIGFTDILLFFAAYRKLWPVLIYLPLQIFFEGNGFWPDQLLAPLFLAAYLGLQNKKHFLTGIFLGLALITKQTAAYFILVIFLAANFRLWPKILLGLFLPLTVTLISLTSQNSLTAFFHQTIIYIFSFHAGNKLQQLWPNLTQILVITAVFSPPIIFGLLKKKYLLVFLTIAASLSMFTRFSYFHLQPALPFLVILVSLPREALAKWGLSLIAIILFIHFLPQNSHTPPKFLNPQILTTAKIISQYFPPNSKTLILTSNDHYYWLTKTIPVGNFFTTSTPWNLAYPDIEDKIIKSLISDKPKYVVIDNRQNKITSYIRQNYHEVLKLPDGSGIFQNNPVGL